jgi:hypothetical protein
MKVPPMRTAVVGGEVRVDREPFHERAVSQTFPPGL